MDKSLHKTTQIEVLTHLAKLGYQVVLIALSSGKKTKEKSASLDVISIPLRDAPLITNAIFVLLLAFFLPLYILFQKPDYIIVEPQDATAFSLIPVLLFPKSKRPKIILDARTALVDVCGCRGNLKVWTFHNSFNIAKKFFDGITTITPMMKENLCTELGIDPKFVGVWTSGVNTRLFNPQKLAKEGTALRIELGLTDKFIVLYHGVFGADRGILETVRSIGRLKEEIDELVLLLVGSGELASSIDKLVKEIGIQDKVIIHDQVDYADVPKYIAMSDIGILLLPDLPMWRTQCPLKLLEYLAMEKVVIVSDIPAHSSVIGKRQCGIYVSSVEPEEISEMIAYAYNHKQMLKQWGSCGREVVSNSYTWEKVANNFNKCLLQCQRGTREKLEGGL